MRFSVYKEAKISLSVLAFILAFVLIFYFVSSMFISMGYKKLKKNEDVINEYCDNFYIIIDPGHGGEDPGAIDNGLKEKDLNLKVALFLDSILNSCGYSTVMTRTDDVLLYSEGQENKKKYYDLRNREEVANKYPNSVFVSIHMNKFQLEYCKGLQVFYSENNVLGLDLANSIQSSATFLQYDNNRAVKSGNENIYLLKHLKIPAVLVECGFLSNNEEAQNLKNDEYLFALAFSIYCGIVEFKEDVK